MTIAPVSVQVMFPLRFKSIMIMTLFVQLPDLSVSIPEIQTLCSVLQDSLVPSMGGSLNDGVVDCTDLSSAANIDHGKTKTNIEAHLVRLFEVSVCFSCDGPATLFQATILERHRIEVFLVKLFGIFLCPMYKSIAHSF